MQPQNQATPNSARPSMPAPQSPAAAVTQKSTPSNPNSTQNTLLFSEIRDGIVIMSDGSFRAVVLAKSINYDLMSKQEQEAVEYAYQSFINSLYFDLQIVAKSRKIDMRPYLEKLGTIHNSLDNMLLAMLMEDYIYFITDLVSETNIMSKQFYLVIPFQPVASGKQAVENSKKLFGSLTEKKHGVLKINETDLEKAKTELKNRVGAVLDGLQQMGVQGVPLDTQELIELYYNTYNPDTAPRQTINSMQSLSAPVITKGTGATAAQNGGRNGTQ